MLALYRTPSPELFHRQAASRLMGILNVAEAVTMEDYRLILALSTDGYALICCDDLSDWFVELLIELEERFHIFIDYPDCQYCTTPALVCTIVESPTGVHIESPRCYQHYPHPNVNGGVQYSFELLAMLRSRS